MSERITKKVLLSVVERLNRQYHVCHSNGIGTPAEVFVLSCACGGYKLEQVAEDGHLNVTDGHVGAKALYERMQGIITGMNLALRGRR